MNNIITGPPIENNDDCVCVCVAFRSVGVSETECMCRDGRKDIVLL